MLNIKEIKDNQGFSEIIRSKLSGLRADTILYVNYPYCTNFCRFCIYKIQKHTKQKQDIFLRYLSKEINLYKKYIGNFQFKNLHIGGGTPNLCNPKLLIEPLQDLVELDKLERFVMEIFPSENLTKYLEQLAPYKVKKIQLGVQTLNDNILKAENREVSSKTILDNMKILSKSQYAWSVDLIYGFDKEKKFGRNYKEELKRILKYEPDGIHFYELAFSYKNNHYGKKFINKKYRYIKNTALSECEQIVKINAYNLIYDEWCRTQANKKYAKKTVCYNEDTEAFPHILGLGLGANSFFRFSTYSNTKELNIYKYFLDNNLFPLQVYFDHLKNYSYPILNVYMAIKRKGIFNYKKFVANANLNTLEITQLDNLYKYLKRYKLKITDNKEIVLTKNQGPKYFFLIKKFYLNTVNNLIND